MTIHEYLNYPMGKGAAMAMIGDAKQTMIEKFLLDESEIVYNLYNTGHTLVFHFELPSHSTKGIKYDIIVEFPYTSEDLSKGNNLMEFPFKVYSNCPSFVYTYAYVFHKHGLICNWLLNRFDKKTLTTPPSQRNSFGVIFYERSIFFALYYIKKNINQSLDILTSSAKKASYSSIKDKVTSQTMITRSTKLQKEENKLDRAKNSIMSRSRNEETDIESVTKNKLAPKSANSAKKARGASKPKGSKKPSRPR